MALRYLGPGFEIHTGGIDNVFPHHEDEIAQSTPVAGGPPVRHWVHGEHLLASGRKMAKSTGNFERVTELRDRGIDPLAFRYLTLTVRYGRKLNYSPPSIEAAAAALGSLRAHLAALGPPPADGPWAAPPALRAGSAGARPIGIANGVAGHQADASMAASPDSRSRIARTSSPRRSRRPALRSTTASSPPSTTTWTCPPPSPWFASAPDADLAADERRWLVLDADLVLGLDLDRAWDGRCRRAGADEVLSARCGGAARGARGGARGTGLGAGPTRCATTSRRWGSRSSTAPAARRRRRAGGRDLRASEQQVATRRVSLEHAVEVPLRQPLAVRLGHDVQPRCSWRVVGRAHGPSRPGTGVADGGVVALVLVVGRDGPRLHQMSRFR